MGVAERVLEDTWDGVIETNTLMTERLFIQTLWPRHVTDSYIGWLNDPEVTRYLECRHEVWTLDTVCEYASAQNKGGAYLFGIWLAGTRRHIGNLRISPPLARHPASEISIMIGDRSAWGQGYAPEAIRAATLWAWANTPIRKLWAGLYAANVRSNRAFRKAGYAWEARHVKHYMLDGEMVDVIELGACKP